MPVLPRQPVPVAFPRGRGHAVQDCVPPRQCQCVLVVAASHDAGDRHGSSNAAVDNHPVAMPAVSGGKRTRVCKQAASAKRFSEFEAQRGSHARVGKAEVAQLVSLPDVHTSVV